MKHNLIVTVKAQLNKNLFLNKLNFKVVNIK